MIYSVSFIKKHPTIKDFCWIEIERKEPEVNNNELYIQKVMGSYKSVKWFRNHAVIQMFRDKQFSK
jgi:hypothetical protein